MASIFDLLMKIKEAKYGKDVRQSIHDAIQQCYNDATGNPESIAAHVGDTENPHNVTAEQIGLKTAAADISALQSPEFEDYTADGATVPDARAAISEITSKMSMFTFLGKAKAALMGLVTLGEMRALLVNNGLTTESGKYFLDAAYGKVLADLIAANAASLTQLNSDVVIYRGKITGDFNNYKSTGFHQYDGGSALNSPTTGGAIVLVLSGPTYTIQLSMSHNAITARRWNGSVWSEWY